MILQVEGVGAWPVMIFCATQTSRSHEEQLHRLAQAPLVGGKKSPPALGDSMENYGVFLPTTMFQEFSKWLVKGV